MRFAVRLGLVSAMSLTLAAATPAVFANAAAVQHLQRAHAVARTHTEMRNRHLAVAIPLRPGRHVVSDAVTLRARSFSAQAAASSSPEVQVRVGPGNCAGYNGEAQWAYSPGIDAWYIDTWGVLWDNCGEYEYPSTAYIYVSYNELDEPRQNYSAGSVYAGGSGNVSKGINTGAVPTMDIFGPSDITFTACWQSPAYGWQCGKGQSV